jgi:hypothetical protein
VTYKILFNDKKFITKIFRLILKFLVFFGRRKVYDFFLNSKKINLVKSYKQDLFYFIPSSALVFFLEGADHKRFNTSNLYPIFKKSLFSKSLKKKHSIIQIGSSWGEEILYLNELAIENECEVYCIEPNAIRFECLKRNVKELKLKKIKCINKFASNKNSSNSISLDYFFKNKKISAIIIDTDGNELNVIQGGLKTIKKFKPLIVAEFLPKLDYSGFKGINVLKEYEKKGFQVLHPQFENVKLSYDELINLFDSNLFSITHDIILKYTKNN